MLFDEETDANLFSDDDEGDLEIFLMGLVNAAMAKVRYEMGNAARAHCKDNVFCLILRSQERDFSEGAGFQRGKIHVGNVSVLCHWIAYSRCA